VHINIYNKDLEPIAIKELSVPYGLPEAVSKIAIAL
jgi:hypothetical protein